MSSTGTLPALAASDDRTTWVARTLHRVQAEYNEMPGLCLTSAQAARLLGLELHESDALLMGLADTGFLRATPTGYVRG